MLWIAALLLFSRRRLYVYQFNGKYQGGIRLDLTGLTSTIGQLLGNIKLPFAAHRHHRKGLGPSFDDLIATESGGLRIALIAAVKLYTIDSLARIFNSYPIGSLWHGTVTGLDNLILQATGRGLHVGFARVFLQPLLITLLISGRSGLRRCLYCRTKNLLGRVHGQERRL